MFREAPIAGEFNYNEDLLAGLETHEIEDIRLGICRRVGRAAFELIMSLDEDAVLLYKHPTLSFGVAAWTLATFSRFDATLARGQQYFGEALGDDDVPSPEFHAAFHDLYRYGPIFKHELRSFSDDDRQALTSIAGGPPDDRMRGLDELSPQLHGYVERTHQWLTTGTVGIDAIDRRHKPWLQLPEGVREVRQAANVLFHYLANDGWLFAGLEYEPPQAY